MKITAITAMALMARIDASAEETAQILETLKSREVISALRTAWTESTNGTSGIEATFRLDSRPAGYDVVAAGRTMQFLKQTVSIIPGVTFALFHVHPNRGEPAPSQNDRKIADKYNIKIVTIHIGGLYEYDPVTRKTTKLRDGLDWISPVQN